MKTKLMIASGAVLFAAAVSAFVYVNNERDSMDDLFNANVEALAKNEGTPVKECFIKSDGIWTEYAIFCNTRTTSNMIYPCQENSWGCKGAVSHCTE